MQRPSSLLTGIPTQNVNALLEQDRVRSDAKLRLAILYALRYQKYAGNQIASVVERLLKAGVPESRAAVSSHTSEECDET